MGCSICGFEPVFGRGLCAAHYYRQLRHGDPLHGGDIARERPRGLNTEAEVFGWFMPGEPPIASTDQDGCWDWPAATRNGFGTFSLQGKSISAHHAAYRIYRGQKPKGTPVTQTCGRQICCQPAHLQLGKVWPTSKQIKSSAVLTEDDVRWVRQQKGVTHRAIAEQLGVSRDTITAILNGKRWKHIE